VTGLRVQRVSGDEGDGALIVRGLVVAGSPAGIRGLAVLATLVLAGSGGEAGEQVSEVGDLVVLGVDVKLGGDGSVGQVVGGEQVRGLAFVIPGAPDGLAVDGQLADAEPAGG